MQCLCVPEHILHHYIGDAVAPNTKTDATLDSRVKEAASVRVERDIKYFDALDDWKGEGSEKKEKKCDEKEENGEEAEHDEGISMERSCWSRAVVKVVIERARGYGGKMS